jgi:hypothetical protein
VQGGVRRLSGTRWLRWTRNEATSNNARWPRKTAADVLCRLALACARRTVTACSATAGATPTHGVGAWSSPAVVRAQERSRASAIAHDNAAVVGAGRDSRRRPA